MQLAPSGRLVRFVSLTILLEATAAVGGARWWMIHPIRADGGTWTEYLFFGVYSVVLLLGVGSVILLLGTVARWLLGARGEQLLAISAGALTALALFADEMTFAFLGLHPYGAATWTAVSSADVRQHVPGWAFAAVAGIVVLAVLLSAWLWGVAGRDGTGAGWARIEAALPRRIPAYFAVGLVTFLALDSPDEERVVPRAALPFYGLWIAPARSYPDARPAYPSGADPAPAVFRRRPDIVMVLVESLRWDELNPRTMPFLSRLVRRPGCVAAPRHYAGGHLTQYGTFPLLYGIGPYAFLPFMKEGRRSEPLAALRSAGYRLETYDATGLLYYTIAPVVPSQMDRYESLLGRDSTVIQRLVHSLTERADVPRFEFAFLYSTHGPYLYPPSFARLPTSGPAVGTRAGVFNQYHNAAGYVDSLLSALDVVAPRRGADGSAVLVIAGDHGEEFWEHGLLGHAAVQFHDERTRVAMVICFPAARQLDLTLSTNADVFPTLFDWMGAAGWDSTRLTGRSLLQPSPEKVVVLAGAGFPTQAGVFALVTTSHKFWVHLNGPDLRAVTLDSATDTQDRPVPLSEDVRKDFGHALSIYLRDQGAVLRVN